MPASGERSARTQRTGRGRADASRSDDAEGRQANETSADRQEMNDLTVAAAAQEGMRQIAAITNKKPEGVTSVEPSDNGWVIEVEVLEDKHVPSSADVLGLYEVEVDADGELRSYRRTQRYPRGRPSGTSGEES